MHKVPENLERGGNFQENFIGGIIAENSKSIFAIIGRNDISNEDFDRILGMLHEEVKDFNTVKMVKESGNYILFKNYLGLSDKDLIEKFLFRLINVADKYPLIAFCFLSDFKAFSLKGIMDIPKINDMLGMLIQRRIEIKSHII